MVRRFDVTSSPRVPSPRVAPRTSTPAVVGQSDTHAVDLHLRNVTDDLSLVGSQPPLHAIVERAQIVVRVCVVEAQHGLCVLNSRKTRRHTSAHALRWRIGCGEIRMCRFKVGQLPHEGVELIVGDLWCVEDVIALFVVANEDAQVLDPVGRRHGARLASGADRAPPISDRGPGRSQVENSARRAQGQMGTRRASAWRARQIPKLRGERSQWTGPGSASIAALATP